MMLRKKRGFSSCAPPPLNSRTTLDLSICTTNAAVVHPHVTQRGPLAIRNKLQRQKGHIHASLRGVQKLCHGRNGGSKHCSIKRMNPFSSLPVSCPKFLSCTFRALAYHGIYSGCLEVQVCIDPVLATDVPHCLVIFKRILFTKQRNQTICVCEPT